MHISIILYLHVCIMKKSKYIATDKPSILHGIIKRHGIKEEYSILDIGIGDGLQYAIEISNNSYISEYTGIEPCEKLYNILKRTQQKHDVNIKNIQLKDYKNKKFDIVLFSNYFHKTKDLNSTLSLSLKLLSDNGLLIIKEPRSFPKGWSSNKYNSRSKHFDKDKWRKKKIKLKYAKYYLLNMNNIKYYKRKKRNVFVYINKQCESIHKR